VLTASAFSIDFEKAEKAIREYSWTKQTTYISVLVDYGFTEEQIKAWRITGVFISNYIGQLQGLLNGYGVANQEMALASIRNNAGKELSADDLARVEQFIKDITAVAVKIRDDTKAAKEEENKRQIAAIKEKEEDARRKEEEESRAEAEELARQYKEEEQKGIELGRKYDQYAGSFGLEGYLVGIYRTQGKYEYNDYKTAMIVPDRFDASYTVDNLVGKYVIYSISVDYIDYYIALLAEPGSAYPAESRLDTSSGYQVIGTDRFTNFLGRTRELIVLKRLGPLPK